jgi:hypothetical protein
MPSKPPSADGPQVEPSAAQGLTPEMQTATTTTTMSRPRPAAASRMDDERLDDLLRRELGKAHDWILEAPVPAFLLKALRAKPGG